MLWAAALTAVAGCLSAPAAAHAEPLASGSVYAYVVMQDNADHNAVAVIDTATSSIAGRIDLGPGELLDRPQAVAIAAHANVGAVLYRGRLVLFDTLHDSVTGRIDLPGIEVTDHLAVSPDGLTAYVTGHNRLDHGTDVVAVVNLPAMAMTTTVRIDSTTGGYGNLGAVTVAPDGGCVYVTDEEAPHLSVIETATNSVTRTTDLVGAHVPAADMALSADGSTAFVETWPSIREASTVVEAVSTSTLSAASAPHWPAGIGTGTATLGLSSDGSHLYAVGIDSRIRQIDTATGDVTGTAAASRGTFAVAGTDTTVYALDATTTVQTYDPGTMTPTGSIGLSSNGWAITLGTGPLTGPAQIHHAYTPGRASILSADPGASALPGTRRRSTAAAPAPPTASAASWKSAAMTDSRSTSSSSTTATRPRSIPAPTARSNQHPRWAATAPVTRPAPPQRLAPYLERGASWVLGPWKGSAGRGSDHVPRQGGDCPGRWLRSAR